MQQRIMKIGANLFVLFPNRALVTLTLPKGLLLSEWSPVGSKRAKPAFRVESDSGNMKKTGPMVFLDWRTSGLAERLNNLRNRRHADSNRAKRISFTWKARGCKRGAPYLSGWGAAGRSLRKLSFCDGMSEK